MTVFFRFLRFPGFFQFAMPLESLKFKGVEGNLPALLLVAQYLHGVGAFTYFNFPATPL
jgi:hypothetical protein